MGKLTTIGIPPGGSTGEVLKKKTGTNYDVEWGTGGGGGSGTVTSIATTAPITGGTITTSGTIGITQATTSTDGYLSATDWNTFNGKQNALTNPVTGTGTSGQVTYWTGTNSVSGSATFVYTPTSQLLVNNAVTASGAIARGINFTPSLTAAANNDVLTGLEIDTTFTTGAFTGTNSIGLSVRKGKLQVLNGWVGNTGTSDVGFFGNPLASDQFIGVDALQGSTSGIIFRSQQQERIRIFRSATNFNLQVTSTGIGSPTFTHFYSTGNTFLGQSPTDAGFKLDVNGTARVQGNLTISDAINVILGTTTGTKIGTSTSQKIGFFNASPVVQPSAVTTSQGIADALSSLGLLASSTLDDTDLIELSYTLSSFNYTQRI